MTHLLDVYQHWLGIPPQEQPPHFYRLLDVPLFEADPRAISSGADRRIDVLSRLTTGPQGDVARRLIQDVIAARQCLVDLQQRRRYDEVLRNALQATSAKPTHAPVPSVASTSPPVRNPDAYPPGHPLAPATSAPHRPLPSAPYDDSSAPPTPSQSFAAPQAAAPYSAPLVATIVVPTIVATLGGPSNASAGHVPGAPGAFGVPGAALPPSVDGPPGGLPSHDLHHRDAPDYAPTPHYAPAPFYAPAHQSPSPYAPAYNATFETPLAVPYAAQTGPRLLQPAPIAGDVARSTQPAVARPAKKSRRATNPAWELVKIVLGGIGGVLLANLVVFYLTGHDLLGRSGRGTRPQSQPSASPPGVVRSGDASHGSNKKQTGVRP